MRANWRTTTACSQPRQRVPLPGAAGDLQRVDAMELLDGWLISFSFVRSSYNAEGALPFQQIVRVDDSGRVQTVARRDVHRDYFDTWRYQNWFPSPVVYAVQKAAKTAFADGMAPLPKRAAPIPMSMQVLARPADARLAARRGVAHAADGLVDAGADRLDRGLRPGEPACVDGAVVAVSEARDGGRHRDRRAARHRLSLENTR